MIVVRPDDGSDVTVKARVTVTDHTKRLDLRRDRRLKRADAELFNFY